MGRTVDQNKEFAVNMEASSKEERSGLAQRLDILKSNARAGSTRANGKVKSLESKIKGQEREMAKQIGNQERILLEQVRIAAQQEADELRDAKQSIERRFVELTSSIRAKEREIGTLRKQSLAYERQVKRLELRVDEHTHTHTHTHTHFLFFL